MKKAFAIFTSSTQCTDHMIREIMYNYINIGSATAGVMCTVVVNTLQEGQDHTSIDYDDYVCFP